MVDVRAAPSLAEGAAFLYRRDAETMSFAADAAGWVGNPSTARAVPERQTAVSDNYLSGKGVRINDRFLPEASGLVPSIEKRLDKSTMICYH
jgi:hypothetical protein